jgi:phosphopantothenoylcysteine decarboxylase/phosphopantothenate--cysteine ligase
VAQLVPDDVTLIDLTKVNGGARARTRPHGRTTEITGAVQIVGSRGVPLIAGHADHVRLTHEPIDPVRYIANRSSGKQGHAIAAAAAAAGTDVTLVSGPVNVPDPPGVRMIKVETAREMLRAVERALPVDVAIFAAAVADWRVANAGEQKLKKTSGRETPELELVENPDILATVAKRKTQRPKLVIGFAAETENITANAKTKLSSKGCDWILANDVSPQSGVMGGDRNTITLVSASGAEAWPTQGKDAVAAMLVARIADALAGGNA